MNNTPQLGKLLKDTSVGRDAIHVAIVPVVAGQNLLPGQDIGLNGDGTVGQNTPPIGIVDPYLENVVQKGEVFYMCLYPESVTGMKHHWEHPAFPNTAADTPPIQEQVVDSKEDSRKWMEDYAAKHYSSNEKWHYDGREGGYGGLGRHYTADEIIKAAEDYLRTGWQHTQEGSDSLRDDTDLAEFWHHFEVITGTKLDSYHRSSNPFSCSC